MIVLDTHVLIWLRFGNRTIGKRSRRLIDKASREGNVAVSAISFWEVAMLHEKRRFTLLRDVSSWRRNLLDEGLVELPVDGDIAVRAGLLSNMRGDPADRIIVATALEGHQLVTGDRRILDWPGHLSRLDATE